MSGESIESSLAELTKLLRERCPRLCPAIFPSRYTPKELTDLCNEAQHSKVAKWLVSRGSPAVRFDTALDAANGFICITAIHEANETDSLLGNLESMMSLLAQGSEEEIEVCKKRFLQVNQHSGEKDLEHRVFVETYNIAYAIKVLISNMPMQLKISKVSSTGKGAKSKAGAVVAASPVLPAAANLLPLPLENEVKIDALFDAIVQRATGEASSVSSKRGRADTARNDSESDSASSSDDDVEQVKKPRKKKRSAGGGGGGGKK